jgi:hypothetical protein
MKLKRRFTIAWDCPGKQRRQEGYQNDAGRETDFIDVIALVNWDVVYIFTLNISLYSDHTKC